MDLERDFGLDPELKNEFTMMMTDNDRKILFSEKYSDIAFVVNGKKIPAHKIIVLERCQYFA